MTTLSIVIPAFNEEAGIAQIMNRVLKVRNHLAGVGINGFELLVVDDGSRDDTLKIARGIACDSECIRVISHPRNRGYGAALKTGFSLAKGELIGFLDADGTYPPEYFPQLCQEALKGTDLVIGSRMAGAESKMPFSRRIGNFFFANLLSLLGNRKITDSASGMRVFFRDVLEQIYPLPDGLNLTPVMSARALHENIKMAEIPITYNERAGRSKLSIFRDGMVFLQSILWTVLSYNPVRILGIIGLAGILLAGLIGVGLVGARLSGIQELGIWGVAALFLGLLSGVCGVSVFSLGSAFNYLVSLFYRQPIRQGLFGKRNLTSYLDRHIGWIGICGSILGTAIGVFALVMGNLGWDISRFWLYLLGSAMMILIGFQFIIFGILMRVLRELSKREDLTAQDLQVSVSD